MKRNITLFVFAIFAVVLATGSLFAGDPDDPKDNGYTFSVIKKDRLNEDYVSAKKLHDVKMGKPLDIYFDFQLGFGSTTASVENATTKGTYTTSSKLGFITGGTVSINVFDFFSFTSGLEFNGKSFSFQPPALDSSAITNFGAGEQSISSTYLNIPLNINVGGMITEKFGLTFWGGPYLGIRLNTDNPKGMGYKNFDLGLTGTLTANYVVAYPFSLILGTNFQFGGLNNLGETNFINNITTRNFSIFTGGRIWF